MAELVNFVIFGGTGDLTRRKLVPALAELVNSGVLDSKSTIIGLSRKDMADEEYNKFLMDSVKEGKYREHISQLNVKYLSLDVSAGKLDKLGDLLAHCRGDCKTIFYLATSFLFFNHISRELKRLGLNKSQRGFSRIIFEKPFGRDLQSSKQLSQEIHNSFDEESVYRIDHYLAKETIQNMVTFNFTNPIIHSTMNNRYVEKIEIIADEELGVGERLGYYHESGAIRDMIQSHLLQIVSIILMDKGDIHDEKKKVMDSLELMPMDHQLIGQYSSYGSELKSKSLEYGKTETFAKIVLNCKNKRWDGVPIVIRTGKKVKKKKGQVIISFKSSEKGLPGNKILINMYPKQDIVMSLNARDPFSEKLKEVNFEFSREKEFGPNTVDEYSVLIGEAISGDKTLFARDDEVQASWKIVEKIENNRKDIKFVIYEDGIDPESIK
ncbi:MAG: glucose-6-phosphate dehydrogenase [archaeon]